MIVLYRVILFSKQLIVLLATATITACTTNPEGEFGNRFSNATLEDSINFSIDQGDYQSAIRIGIGYQKDLVYAQPSVLLQLGLAHMFKGEASKAQSVFSKLIKDYPKQPEGYFGAALLEYRFHNIEGALDTLLLNPDVSKNHPPSLNLLGICLDASGYHIGAQNAFKHLIRQYPKYKNEGRVNLAFSLLLAQDSTESRRLMNQLRLDHHSTLDLLARYNLQAITELDNQQKQ